MTPLLVLPLAAFADPLAADAPVEIVAWHAMRGAEEQSLQAVAEAFEAHRGIHVRLVQIPFGAFDSKLETAIPRGNGPDLFIAGHGSLGKWTAMQMIEPVLDSEPVDAFLPVSIEALTLDGRLWGLPLAVKSVLLLYDPDQIAVPPKTTDELLQMAHTATHGDHWGLVYQASEPYFHASWMHAFGGAAFDAAGTVQLAAPAQTQAFAFAKNLVVDAGVGPGQATGELVSRLYDEGKVAFVISGPWFVADARRPIAAVPLPIVSPTGTPARPYLTVDAVFIAKNTIYKKDTRVFANLLAGDLGATLRRDLGKQAVANVHVPPNDPLLVALSEQAKTAVPLPTNAEVGTVFEAQARALRRVLRGAATPEDAAIEAQDYYEALSRPAPPPTDPRPYLALMVAALSGLAAFTLSPLRERSFRESVWSHRWEYLWIAPAALSLTALVVAPFVTGAAVAFFAHHTGDWTFVGLQNFTDILLARDFPMTSPLSFFHTLAVTVLWTGTNVILHVTLGVALAMVLREPWIRLRGLWRALLILPWAIPNYITALIWKGLFHTQFGAINALLGGLRGEPVQLDWFGSFATAFAANLATNTWLGFPFMLVVTLGALQSIPKDLEEAAIIDGAGPWFRFRYVLWPLLRPALMPAMLLGSVWTFNQFNVIYLVSGGEPDGGTEILVSQAYRWAFSRGNRYGYASAYALLIFGVLWLYSRAANRLAGKKVI